MKPWKRITSSKNSSTRSSRVCDVDAYVEAASYTPQREYSTRQSHFQLPCKQELSNQSSSNPSAYNSDYVEILRKRFQTQQNERKSVKNNEKLGCDIRHIFRRLKEQAHPCDLTSFTCLAGCCGRTFERIQVLAFHISYAHQDLMTADSGDLTCLLCGKKWTTVRRKIMHLSLAHREIGEEHNSQCMLQVESVIAPNAPKAQRLQKAQMIFGDGPNNLYDELESFVEADDVEGEYSYSI